MQKYFRFAFGLRKFLKDIIEPEEAIEIARINLTKRIQNREKNFLNLIEKGIFNYKKSPYLKLLEQKKIIKSFWILQLWF